MGFVGTIGSIIGFPFKLIFKGGKKKEPAQEQLPNFPTDMPPHQLQPADVAADNLKAKVDLMLSQVDSLRLEYDAINQRLQTIERMVRELYMMAKS